MRVLLLVTAFLSLLLLAAHAYRWGDVGQAMLWTGMAGLLFLRREWCRWVLVALLLYGASQWWGTATMLAQMRMVMGQPWMRLALILAGVIVLTLAACALLLTPAARQHFSRGKDTAALQTAAFLLTLALLLVARDKAPLQLLLADRFFAGAGWGIFQSGAHAFYAAFLAGALHDPARHSKLRPIVWGGFSLVFFSQLALGLGGVDALLMTGRLHLPVPALVIGGPLYRGGGFFMLILFGFTVLLTGPAWCSHLCYIGAWDDGCSRLKRAGAVLQPEKTPLKGRAVTLGLTLLCALGLRLTGVPVGWAVLLAAAFGLGGVWVMLWFSRRRGRMVHCTQYCPLGLVANLLGRLTPWRMRMGDGCTRCGKCSRACRYGALRREDIARGRPGLSCTLCGDCVVSCKEGQLWYSCAGLSPAYSRAVFVTLVSSLHAVFLAVARI